MFRDMAWRNNGGQYLTQARGFFDRALALDPGNIDALVGTAMSRTRTLIRRSLENQTSRRSPTSGRELRRLRL
jgi:hypothetical protein